MLSDTRISLLNRCTAPSLYRRPGGRVPSISTYSFYWVPLWRYSRLLSFGTTSRRGLKNWSLVIIGLLSLPLLRCGAAAAVDCEFIYLLRHSHWHCALLLFLIIDYESSLVKVESLLAVRYSSAAGWFAAVGTFFYGFSHPTRPLLSK